MRNIRLTIEYDGTNYQGWQRQKNTHQTLQEIIEKTAKRILPVKFHPLMPPLHGSSHLHTPKPQYLSARWKKLVLLILLTA